MQQRDSILVGLDASLFTESSSVGHVTGEVELLFLPVVGGKVSLVHRQCNVASSVLEALTVEHVLPPGGTTKTPAVMLSDIVVKTKTEAFKVAQNLERCFGLYADIHGDADFREYKKFIG